MDGTARLSILEIFRFARIVPAVTPKPAFHTLKLM
jgi:hypothetical protein